VAPVGTRASADEEQMKSHFNTVELSELHNRIQAYLRAHALGRPDHERIGPFLAGFDEEDDNPFRNYAVPDDGASPDADEIERLVAAFARRKRKPRLEYIAAAAPDVEPALLAQGFAIEKRYPIMICDQSRLSTIALPGTAIAIAAGDDEIVEAAHVGAEAYGGDSAYAEPLRRLAAQGGVLAVARDIATGMMAGAGMATPQHQTVTEIAGIGVRDRFRRQGIAGALTSFLAREAFARGATLAWLTPGHDDAERIYARAGFVPVSEQLHISKEV
jgi:GNAT superfamily N-acetyltransferase